MELYHPLELGRLKLPGNLFLAPVAGYSDAAFRSVCFGLGADLCYTEMVSSEALVRSHPATSSLMDRAENESRFAIQLFGSSPEVLAQAALLAAEKGPALIDLNCGCPVPKIVRNGGGSALTREPSRIYDIVKAMNQALKQRFGDQAPPVTAKVRSGWDEASITYKEAGQAAVEGGAVAVTLHARTRAQGYSGKADWQKLASLAALLPVPVFGSGDVFEAQDAVRMITETGCAGVMIARGAMGNPFIFREAKEALLGQPISPPTVEERVETARLHLKLAVRFLGERKACIEFRKQLCEYTKGCRGGSQLRQEAVQACTPQEFEAIFAHWLYHAEAVAN